MLRTSAVSSLGTSHARLMAEAPETYAKGNSRGFWEVVARLVAAIRGRRAGRAEIVPGSEAAAPTYVTSPHQRPYARASKRLK